MENQTQTQIIKNINDAKALLPEPYRRITEEDLEINGDIKLAIDTLKESYEDKGGIHLLEVDEYQIISRVPNDTILNHSIEGSKRRTAIESDRWLVDQCRLYPSQDVFDRWLKAAPGLASPFANKLLDLAKTRQVVSGKKL